MFTDFQRRLPRFSIPTNPVSSVCHKAIHISLRGPISLSPPPLYWNHSSNIAVKHCRWKLRAGVPVGFVSKTLPPHYRSDIGVRPKTRSPRRSTSSTPSCCSKRSAGVLRPLCSFGSRSRETVYLAHLGFGFSLSQLRGFRAARSHLGFLSPPPNKATSTAQWGQWGLTMRWPSLQGW